MPALCAASSRTKENHSVVLHRSCRSSGGGEEQARHIPTESERKEDREVCVVPGGSHQKKPLPSPLPTATKAHPTHQARGDCVEQDVVHKVQEARALALQTAVVA